jgi:prepilin-type N-terminal cleavage/methylation domain-containing protein
MHRFNRKFERTSGFTLIELAVVVVVITLLLGSLLIPLATQVDQRNVSETQKRLQEIKDSLIGYALANGRFPCPAGNQPADTGIEKFAGGGTASNGNCSDFFDGYVPGITLGLSNLDTQGFVVDAWGLQQNRIRYAVSNATITSGATTVPNAFTAQGGMRSLGVQALGSGVDLLFVCATAGGSTTNCGTATVLTKDAVFVVYSLGKNAATSGGASADELVNVNAGNNPVFVSKLNSASTVTGEFDDILLWTSRYNVISQLIASGQL